VSDLLQIADSLDPEARHKLYTAMARDSLRSTIQSCTLCPLHQTSIQRVPWEGGPSPIAIVGEAPGASEDRVGRPFVGQAGKLLDSILTQVGLSRGSVAIVNRICCRPPSNDYQLAISLGAPDACKPWFDMQLATTESWALVLMGNSALSAFSDKPISSVRGKRWWQDGYYLIPTYHPAYALRNPNAVATIAQDLACLKDIIDGNHSVTVPKNYDPNHAIATLRTEPLTENDRKQFAKFYKKNSYVVFYSQHLGERVIVAEGPNTPVDPSYDSLPRYTVAEVEKLSRWTSKTWSDLIHIHTIKKTLGGEILL
jgi:uracil-DNA glycosylase family 4